VAGGTDGSLKCAATNSNANATKVRGNVDVRASWGAASSAPDMERPVNYECCFFFLPGPEAGWVAIEEAISTIDQSDIRGSSRIIVIRRELPRTTSAGWVLRPTA